MDMETLRGTVDQVHYQDDNGFHVLSVAMTEAPGSSPKDRLAKVVGVAPTVRAGEQITASGHWSEHPRFGRQFKASAMAPAPPESIEGIRAYLAAGAVSGIGPAVAHRLVDRFGGETTEALADPRRLTEIHGIGEKRAAQIAEAWRTNRDHREGMIFLQGHGLGAAQARKVCEQCGSDTVTRVQQNPYRTLLAIKGIGFRIADAIASSIGFDREHPDRVVAGIRHAVDERAQAGHTAGTSEEIVQAATKLLGVGPGRVQRSLNQLIERERLVQTGDGRVGLPWLLHAERDVAGSLRAMAAPLNGPRPPVPEVASDGVTLTEEQRGALATLLGARVGVLTGGPGVGKTTVTRTLADLLALQVGCEIALCAPTGRAARRLAESTGRQAKTIHRLLGAGPDGFSFNADNPLTVDAVLVDEVSMVDVQLMAALLEALPAGARLILIGDPHQLPAVGPGNVLRDVLRADDIPVARLTQIHRQAEDSRIITEAHRINDGRKPTGADDFVVEAADDLDPEAVAERVIRWATQTLPQQGFDPVSGVQVLTPMHKGPLGTMALNDRLRTVLQDLDPEATQPAGQKVGPRHWLAGDKVVQTVNDYNLGVFNGDLGVVTDVSAAEGVLTVAFDSGTAEIDAEAAANLRFAYALTGHKAQGSEFPAIVVPVTTQHWIMLERQWLYTTVTRGRDRVVLIADDKGLRRAVEHRSGHRRSTTLAERLRGAL